MLACRGFSCRAQQQKSTKRKNKLSRDCSGILLLRHLFRLPNETGHSELHEQPGRDRRQISENHNCKQTPGPNQRTTTGIENQTPLPHPMSAPTSTQAEVLEMSIWGVSTDGTFAQEYTQQQLQVSGRSLDRGHPNREKRQISRWPDRAAKPSGVEFLQRVRVLDITWKSSGGKLLFNMVLQHAMKKLLIAVKDNAGRFNQDKEAKVRTDVRGMNKTISTMSVQMIILVVRMATMWLLPLMSMIAMMPQISQLRHHHQVLDGQHYLRAGTIWHLYGAHITHHRDHQARHRHHQKRQRSSPEIIMNTHGDDTSTDALQFSSAQHQLLHHNVFLLSSSSLHQASRATAAASSFCFWFNFGVEQVTT